jgi:acetylornithine deacetylase
MDAVLADCIEELTPRWVEMLRRLVQTPSCFEQEHEIVDLVASSIEALGAVPERVLHDPAVLAGLPDAQPPISLVTGRSSVVARIAGTGGGRSLVINAHLDVVAAGDTDRWTHPPFAADTDEVALYGRGAMDDKAGVAIALALLECLCRGAVRPAGDVVFHFVLEDEITGNGSLLCLDAGYGADAAVIVDGTRLDRAISEHAGNMQARLVVRGAPASVSVSHMGVNAAEVAAAVLLALRESVHELNDDRRPPWTEFPSPYQLSVQSLHSEGAALTVPETAEATLWVTFPPPETVASMRDRLEAVAVAAEAALGLSGTVDLDWSCFAAEPVRGGNDELARALASSAERVGLPAPRVSPSTGTSDLRHFAAYGIPCLLYGPGRGFNPHRPDEHYLLEDLPRMVALYAELLREWCGEGNYAGAGDVA